MLVRGGATDAAAGDAHLARAGARRGPFSGARARTRGEGEKQKNENDKGGGGQTNSGILSSPIVFS